MIFGHEFIVHFDGKRFGFRTHQYLSQDQSRQLEDGSWLWVFDQICCEITSFSAKHKDERLRTFHHAYYSTRFDDECQQNKVIAILRRALSNYHGEKLSREPAPASVEFTPGAEAKIKSGAYIR